MSLAKSGIKTNLVLTPVPSCFSLFSRVRPTNALCQIFEKLAAVWCNLPHRIVEEVKGIFLHAILNRLKAEFSVAAGMCLGCIFQIPKIASACPTLISTGTISGPLGSRLLLEVDLVEGEDPIGPLGRDPHPGDRPFGAGLALVGTLNVVLPTKMASHLLHLDLGAEDVVLRICRSCGQPSRAASFPSSFATTLAFADRLSIGESSKRSRLQGDLVLKWSVLAFSVGQVEATPQAWWSSAFRLLGHVCHSQGMPSGSPWHLHKGSPTMPHSLARSSHDAPSSWHCNPPG